MEQEYPYCQEVKYHYSGKVSKADCGLVHLSAGMAVLKYYFQKDWQVEGLELGPPMYTYAFYWEDCPYNLYLWYRADGRLDAAYFNVVDSVHLSRGQVEYRDLIVDVLLYTDGTQTVLDRHELTEVIPDGLMEYIKAGEEDIAADAPEVVLRARMFLAQRGLDADFKGGLTTRHLRLEPPRLEMAKEVSDYYRRNREFLAPWEPERDERFFTPAAQQENLRQQIEAGDTLVFWIRPKDSGSIECVSAESDNFAEVRHRVIGFVKFSNIIRGHFQSCFASYALDKDYCRRGYMGEALEAAIDYLFGFERLHRVEANVVPENKASLRTAIRAGFSNEGLARSYLCLNGRWRDHVHMVRINET
ncbi:MAG: GNAT family N-acetyltransferase [Spirochaetaceae bacterium]|nr:GNAT family N-acetyltransferase [Spirochaetaceae bacterium]MCF7949454.1 GNAT family N-acetyltransferase [Spirochaetia bacterium]MCF7951349.1 GNAT family N-acetyltransferase [Spirochaetaceae bacterium]